MAVPSIPDIRTLMESGMHFGHSSGKWHPKMKPYIFATRDKLHIIDLEKTREKLEEVLGILEERIRDGKTVILVGTKKQVGERIKELGEKTGLGYVDVRWLGGTMTNFAELQKSINRMKKTESFLESNDAEKTIKKERVRMESEVERMNHKFGGLRNMTRKPDALFVIDPSYEHNAVKEARAEGIEIFAIVDTNSNPDLVDHVIPANDDAPKSLTMLLDLVEKTILSGQKLISLRKEEEQKQSEKDIIAATPVKEVPAEELEMIEEKVKEKAAEKKVEVSEDKEMEKEEAAEVEKPKKAPVKKATK